MSTIDLFAILLTHGLMLVATWRLSRRPDLDPPSTRTDRPVRQGWRKRDDA